MADGIRSELTDTLKRIELPISVPAFGSRSNTVNIKRALLAGFFMQVRKCNLLASILPFSLLLFQSQGHKGGRENPAPIHAHGHIGINC